MRISPISFVFVLAGVVALFFAFLAAGMGLASLIFAVALAAGGIWIAWRVIRGKLSHARNRPA